MQVLGTAFRRSLSQVATKPSIAISKPPGTIRRIKPPAAAVSARTAANQTTLPVIAMCTAESYDFARLKEHLQTNQRLLSFVSDDVLHAKIKDDGEVYFFQSGSFVFWPSERKPNYSEDLGQVLRALRPFESGPLSEAESEEMQYKQSDSDAYPSIEGETFCAGKGRDEVMAKLAFSNGLADSVKLASLESLLEAHLEKVRSIPDVLRSGGKLSLTRAQSLQLIGELLHFRAILNLHSELIDTPELYWSEAKLEGIYLRALRLLETRPRISLLNKKLDYANEMAQVLRSHLSEAHGLKLEWGIIALIAVEVAFEILNRISP